MEFSPRGDGMDLGVQSWHEILRSLGTGMVVGLVRPRDGVHILASPQRMSLLRLILARPGISLREASRQLQMNWATVTYHAMRLESAGLIQSRTVGRHRICYPMGNADEGLVEARGILSEATARRIAAFIVEHPGTRISEVIRGTGESQRVVYYHLKRLVDAGLLSMSERGRYRGLVATSKMYAAIA